MTYVSSETRKLGREYVCVITVGRGPLFLPVYGFGDTPTIAWKRAEHRARAVSEEDERMGT